jgi:mannose-6-phosphate isomerase-like protein (cupin superfamily)
MKHEAINLEEKFTRITEYYQPKIIAKMNDYHFKLAKLKGDFVWHTHPETDEAFIIMHGELEIELRNGKVTLRKGEMFVVPKGVEHKPFAMEECRVLLLEPVGTLNTGDAGGEKTVADPEWI